MTSLFKNPLFGAQLEKIISGLTEQIPGHCFAFQVLAADGKPLFADAQFRRLLPGAVDVHGGLTAIWQELHGPRPEDAYSDGPKGWTFVKFTNDPGRLTGDYFIDEETLKVIAGSDFDYEGQYFYTGELKLPNGEQVIWLFLATEDIRIKRDRNRNEIAGKAVLDTIFFVPEDQRPRHFAYRSLPRDGVIGGDFIWAQSFPDNKDPKLECVVLGDGAGHGVEAALQAVQAGVSLRRLMSEEAMGQKSSWRYQDNPAKTLLQALDEDFTASSRRATDSLLKERSTMTSAGGLDACALILDHKAGKIFIASTNMPVWMLASKRKKEETDLEQVASFDSRKGGKHMGFVLDMHSNSVVTDEFERDIPDRKRLRFFLSTDGLIEQRSAKTAEGGGVQFGITSVENILKKKARDNQNATLDSVIKGWENHRHGFDQDDDVLIVVLDVNQR